MPHREFIPDSPQETKKTTGDMQILPVRNPNPRDSIRQVRMRHWPQVPSPPCTHKGSKLLSSKSVGMTKLGAG